MIIEGLRKFRHQFTEAVNAARDGDTVLITEVGFDRRRQRGYKLIALTQEELDSIPVPPVFKVGE